VRVFYSGICGAQINEIQAAKGPDKFLPHLLGHEGYGEVVDVGELVKTVTKGDKVILHWMPGSGIQSDPAQYIWQNKTLINSVKD
jgi:D-arabinose 1-dehydrogenase-like Zn-dependent alcohol dehydrogenase